MMIRKTFVAPLLTEEATLGALTLSGTCSGPLCD